LSATDVTRTSTALGGGIMLDATLIRRILAAS
jgi:hypothetical protein